MRYSSELTVDLGALAFNIELLKSQYSQKEILFMVKANAYGHGILEITSFAHEEMGITHFGCASLGEAMEIRKQRPEYKIHLYVFSDNELFSPEYIEFYTDFNIIPVIQSKQELEWFLNQVEFRFFPIVLKMDSGMHRLGFEPDDLDDILKLLKKHQRNTIHHFMTHFANSYLATKSGDKTQRQLEIFNTARAKFKSEGIHIEHTSCSNSGAIVQKLSDNESIIRPGLMLYGHSSMQSNDLWPGKVISTLKTKCLKKFAIKKGTPIGYGGHVCHQDGYIVYIPLGYGDGLMTSYTGASLQIMGHEAKILGRVSMDVCALYFANDPKNIKISDQIVLWSDQVSIEHWSSETKASAYQLFTGISARVPRRYIK